MSSDPNKQGQYPPPQWESQPQRGAYPAPSQALNYRPPPQAYGSSPSTPGDMVTLPPPQHAQHHQHPGMYPPHDMYAPYPPDPRGVPPQHMAYQSQPAPRQRTAIACRYCRRRKIRCSGFEASDDGRCTNCQRFQQECIFTPVSSQAQAFVPAHTAYPHLRNPGTIPPQRGGRPIYPQQGQPAIYGAHGQPLGTPMSHDPNYPPPPHGYPMPPPGPYQGAPVYDDRGPPQPPHAQDKVSLKRLRSDENFQPAPPPPSAPPEEFSSHTPYQGHPPAPTGRRGSGGGYEYPDPTGLVPASPASSATSYQSAPYPTQGQPYSYPPPQPQQQAQQPPVPRRTSPQSAYSYDARASGSPHGSTSSQPGYQYPSGLHPPQVLPPRDQGRTPPPGQNREGNGNGSGQRGGMAVRDMLAPQGKNADGAGRSSADSDMLRALNKKGPN
ncbi:hypothetical protein OEA41_005512 [Lepraria neglecta]|uniref:Zn(2)-C6 fungal-type domain-containing protein n=1 Tax=Lepraria neglecta TaxID=209136 RepID=A0AAD9YZI9_9LECA|nr:hypothetical protein OEA41_005512 [Lepraria neglecta]